MIKAYEITNTGLLGKVIDLREAVAPSGYTFKSPENYNPEKYYQWVGCEWVMITKKRHDQIIQQYEESQFNNVKEEKRSALYTAWHEAEQTATVESSLGYTVAATKDFYVIISMLLFTSTDSNDTFTVNDVDGNEHSITAENISCLQNEILAKIQEIQNTKTTLEQAIDNANNTSELKLVKITF